MHIPPEEATGVDLTDWYAVRALWRWTRHRKLDNGGGQFRCPQCSGRITTTAKPATPTAYLTAPLRSCPSKTNTAALARPASEWTCSMPTRTSPSALPLTKKATDVEIPARTPSRRSRTRGPQIRMVPRLRSCRSHPRRPGLGYRAQPQTNQAGRKNPNRQATPSGQAQKYPADPHEHPRQRPLPSGAARLGTRPLHSTDSNPYCRLCRAQKT